MIDLKFNTLNWLIGKILRLSMGRKTIVYKVVIKQSYGDVQANLI